MRNLLVVFLITLVVPMLKGQSLDDAFSKTSLCDSSKSRIDLNGLYSCLSEKGINFKTGLTESNTLLDSYLPSQGVVISDLSEHLVSKGLISSAQAKLFDDFNTQIFSLSSVSEIEAKVATFINSAEASKTMTSSEKKNLTDYFSIVSQSSSYLINSTNNGGTTASLSWNDVGCGAGVLMVVGGWWSGNPLAIIGGAMVIDKYCGN